LRVAILASGRGTNFDALAGAARERDFPARMLLVVSDRDDAAVIERARAAQVDVHVFDPGSPRGARDPAAVDRLVNTLREFRVDAICLAGFMRILPAEIVRAWSGRILNVHPSLLPAFPGTRAPRQALRAGVKVSGCTVHLVDEGVDTGPIVMQAAVPVREGDDEDALAARILEREHEIYPAALRALAEGRITVDGRVARVLAPDAVRKR
jgi:phosphoribosylglycinamide formyltransferase-1